MSNTTQNVDTFFENTGGGVGAPSARLSGVDDFVFGEIVDQAIVPKKKFGSDDVEKDSRTGEDLTQLVVILQTEERNWANVAKLPKNEDGSDRAASEDDGRRAVYVPPFTNIHAAVGDAIIAATGSKGPLANGGQLGVKIVELKDTGKGNPLKIHQAKYVAPSASDGFFGGSSDGGAQEQTAPSTPASQPAQQQAAPAAEPQTDPWASDAAAAAKAPAGQTSKPPF